MQLTITRDLILDTTVTEYLPARPKGAPLFGAPREPWGGPVYRADDRGAIDHPYTYWTTREEALAARYGEGATVVEMARAPLPDAVREAFEEQMHGPRPTAHIEALA